MTKTNSTPTGSRQNTPLRVIKGEAEAHARFWNWVPRNEADEQDAELQFYGYISEFAWYEDDITPAKFAADLAKFGGGKPITVRINSGGGEIYAASAIRAMLTDYEGKVTARIDGLCASAAVMVAFAADEINIQDTAYMMIHRVGYAVLIGWMDADVLIELADHLLKAEEGTLAAYVSRTGLDEEELQAMLKAETWLSAKEAVEKNFADTVIIGGKQSEPNQSVQNALNTCINTPQELLNCSSAAPEPSPADVEKKERAECLRQKVSLILKKE